MLGIGSVVDKTIHAAACEDASDPPPSSSAIPIRTKIKVESDDQWQRLIDSGAVDEDSADDEANMGIAGKSYTAADKRLVAKYISTMNDWDLLQHPARFMTFYTRVCFL